MVEFSYVQDVKLFHDKFGLVTPSEFIKLDDDLHSFRTGFFTEELTEYEDAVRDGDLETTLDSLIDLVYIIAGAALLHGIQHEEFYGAAMVVDEFFGEGSHLQDDLPSPALPEVIAQLPDLLTAGVFVTLMRDHIDSYDAIHKIDDMPIAARREYVKYTLAAMFNSCMTAAGYCNCTEALWDELWVDVQRANMSKERALKASDSKRGSTYDVIKPVGWIAPQTGAIIAKHTALPA